MKVCAYFILRTYANISFCSPTGDAAKKSPKIIKFPLLFPPQYILFLSDRSVLLHKLLLCFVKHRFKIKIQEKDKYKGANI